MCSLTSSILGLLMAVCRCYSPSGSMLVDSSDCLSNVIISLLLHVVFNGKTMVGRGKVLDVKVGMCSLGHSGRRSFAGEQLAAQA